MTPIIYFLALVISMLGLGAGVMLAFLTIEELEANRKYLVLAKKLMLGGLLATVGFAYSGGVGTAVLFFVLGFGLGWFVHRETLIYILLGGIFFVGSFFERLFMPVCVLIMLYGFAEGTLLAQDYVQATLPNKVKSSKGKISRAKNLNLNLLTRRAAAAGAAYLLAGAVLFLLKQIPYL